MPKKRNVLTLQQKLQLTRAIERGEKPMDIVRRTGMSYSTIANIWRSRHRYQDAERIGHWMKRLRKPVYDDLDQAMHEWFQEECKQGIRITGEQITTQAKVLAAKLGITDFKGSPGWLFRWRNRQKNRTFRNQGESSSTISEFVVSYMKHLHA